MEQHEPGQLQVTLSYNHNFHFQLFVYDVVTFSKVVTLGTHDLLTHSLVKVEDMAYSQSSFCSRLPREVTLRALMNSSNVIVPLWSESKTLKTNPENFDGSPPSNTCL